MKPNKKIKILILGSTGMLGSAVSKHFDNLSDFHTIKTVRTRKDNYNTNTVGFDASLDNLTILAKDFDYIINCIGIITPHINNNPIESIKINALFPRELSNFCAENNIKLIHITTDCVFSGYKGKYTETDSHDALDFYGKSKSLGECTEQAMVLRTSIVGQEENNFVSLLGWAMSKRGQNINGYANHMWNGITTPYYGKICEQIIRDNLHENGLFHIFAKDDVSKYDLLMLFNERFSLNLKIEKYQHEHIDRTLRTNKKLCQKLNIPTVGEMISQL